MNIANQVLDLINSNSTYSGRQVVVDGITVLIEAKCTKIIDIRRKVIEILTEDSTTSDPHIDPNAEEQFNVAAEKLVRHGEIFYTALRANWSTPMVEWTLL